jgi:uncharacterized protein (UPF0303 family)
MTDLPVFTVAALEADLTALVLPSLDNDIAVDLGLVAVEVIRERELNLAVQVVVGDEVAFRANLKGTGAANDEWLAGKATVAVAFREPSLLVKLRNEDAGTTLAEQGYDFETYRAHGGSIPIIVGDEVVGTITMSGEPDVIDHEACAETVRRFLAR